MKAISWFAGVGGFDIGLERAGIEVVGQCDTQRYKQLGNAVCVNVAEWITKRIVMVQEGEIS